MSHELKFLFEAVIQTDWVFKSFHKPENFEKDITRPACYGQQILSPFYFKYKLKAKDDEVKGDGNQQDYGMRIYDPRLGKFLSIDPLTKNYPMMTPYQFASNAPISGIDLDGLEYLDANKARIYITNGVVALKLSNFVCTNIPLDNLDSKNWNGQIGANTILGDLSLGPKPPTSNQIPGDQLPTLAKGQTETGVQSKLGKYGKRNTPMVDAPGSPKAGIGKASLYVDIALTVADIAITIGNSYDQSLVQEHSLVLKKVEENINDALKSDMIPKEYQNKDALSAIGNVILQGENRTEDKNIYEIGMAIYKKYNPQPESVTRKSGLDNTPDVKIVIPPIIPATKK